MSAPRIVRVRWSGDYRIARCLSCPAVIMEDHHLEDWADLVSRHLDSHLPDSAPPGSHVFFEGKSI